MTHKHCREAPSLLTDDLILTRMGYGAMQLAGPHVFGPPADHDGAIAVLRTVVELGITHIDTSDFYGPHITNQLIKEALYPYPSAASDRDKGRCPARRRRRLAARSLAERAAPGCA